MSLTRQLGRLIKETEPVKTYTAEVVSSRPSHVVVRTPTGLQTLAQPSIRLYRAGDTIRVSEGNILGKTKPASQVPVVSV